MASSTMIPKPNNRANSTMKLSVTCVPTIRSAAGRKDERHEHTQRNRQGHKESVGYTHEEHEDDQHQHETDNDGIHQVVKRGT